jgi:hypothetical protein
MIDHPNERPEDEFEDVEVVAFDPECSGERAPDDDDSVLIGLAGWPTQAISPERRVPAMCLVLNQTPPEEWATIFNEIESNTSWDEPLRARLNGDRVTIGFTQHHAERRYRSLLQSIDEANHTMREKVARAREQARREAETLKMHRQQMAQFARGRGLRVLGEEEQQG